MNSINEVLISCVKASGGSKSLGPLLWPEKTPDSAQRMLLDCLNEERPARLSPDQFLYVLRTARAKGFHEGIEFLCSDLGYSTPIPIEPRDEAAELMRNFVAAVELQAELAKRMEKAAARLNMRAVA
jgi:hypothetical protein